MVWWHQLLIAIGAALLVGLVYYLLQVRRLGSAARERLQTAQKELVDTIEMDTINDQELSGDAISRLIKAAARRHNVNLGRVCSPISLMEDVELQLETNRYLDANKKHDYINRVRIAIENMQVGEVPMPVWPPEELKELKANIIADKKEQALQAVDKLSKQAVELEASLSQLMEESEYRQARWRSLWIGMAVGVAAGMIAALVRALM